MTIKERAKIKARMDSINDRMKIEETNFKPIMFLDDVKKELGEVLPEDKINHILLTVISYANYQENLTLWIELHKLTVEK